MGVTEPPQEMRETEEKRRKKKGIFLSAAVMDRTCMQTSTQGQKRFWSFDLNVKVDFQFGFK